MNDGQNGADTLTGTVPQEALADMPWSAVLDRGAPSARYVRRKAVSSASNVLRQSEHLPM